MKPAGGVIVSITFGTLFGSTDGEQMGLVPPGAHTPNVYAPGVAVKSRVGGKWVPSCPVSATVKVQPEPTVPNVDSGTISVAVQLGLSVTNCALPTEPPAALTQAGEANLALQTAGSRVTRSCSSCSRDKPDAVDVLAAPGAWT